MNIFRISTQELCSCVGKLMFVHDNKKTSSAAYELSEKCKILISLPRTLAAQEVVLDIYDHDISKKLLSLKKDAFVSDGINDSLTFDLDISKLGADLFFAKLRIETPFARIYSKKYGDALCFYEKDEGVSFQISVSNFKYSAPEEKYGGVIYHIFVDRFCKTEKYSPHSDAVYISDWNSEIPEYPAYPGAFLKNNYFYGGDLDGVAEKLDYIADLGVNIIYLSPIFKAYSNHKYDTGNYMEVDESFGGEKALINLIEKAKELGIGIILDGVFNHTGADSLYFNKYGKYNSLGAYQSKKSPYYSWFDFQNHPQKYTSWWGIEILPRINPDKKNCREYFTGSGGVIEKYAKLGILGFRLDVVDELSDSFVKDIKETLNSSNKQSLLYGEVWEDASNKIAYNTRKTYYLGDELDGVMNYPARCAIISFIKNKDISDMKYYFGEVMPNAPKRIRDMQMNLLGTHDTERILTLMGGEDPRGKTNDILCKLRLNKSEYSTAKKRLKSAYAISATIPGVPAIFYGDEAGLQGYHDPFNRRTFPWDNIDNDILSFYKKIAKIRKENDVYKKGEFKLLHLSHEVLIFQRYDEKQSILTIVNNSNKNIKITFKQPVLSLLSGKSEKNITIFAESTEIVNSEKNISFAFSF